VFARTEDEWVFGDGEPIVTEDDGTEEMFVIQEGSVRVTKKVGEREVVLATLERGDFFGEMSLLESMPRDATCKAVGKTKVLAIRSGELLVKIRRDPTFAFEMLQKMSRRIRLLNKRVVQLLEEGGIPVDRVKNAILLSEYDTGDGKHDHGSA